MNFKVVRLGKALAARLAAKWQLNRVGRIVLRQLVEIRVAFPTDTAVQRVVLFVHLHVVLDMALLDEGLVADVAPIGSLVAVDPDVVDQVDLLDEADAADEALVGTLAGVDLGVVRQGRGLHERFAASLALEGALARVDPLVVRQRRLVGKDLAALVAPVGQLRAVDAHVVVELVLVLEVLAAHLAPVLGHLVVVVVFAFLLARRFDGPNELLLGDLRDGADVIFGVLFLDLDDESLGEGREDDGFGGLRFLFLFAGGRCSRGGGSGSGTGVLRRRRRLLEESSGGEELGHVQLVRDVLDDDVVRYRWRVGLVRIDLLLQVDDHARGRLLLLRRWRLLLLWGWWIARLLLLGMMLGS